MGNDPDHHLLLALLIWIINILVPTEQVKWHKTGHCRVSRKLPHKRLPTKNRKFPRKWQQQFAEQCVAFINDNE